MAFRFSLAAVLSFRQRMEHQQEMLLRESNQHVDSLRREIGNIDSAIVNLARSEAQQLVSGLSAAELQFDLLCHYALMKRRLKLENEMAHAEQLCASRREAFRQARQQREVLDALRTHQLELFLQQGARQEQRSLDDLFLLRRAFLRRN